MSSVDASSAVFDFSSGSLCLDFTNTWEDRDQPTKDHLRDYNDWLNFAHEAAIIEGEDKRTLGLYQDQHPEEVNEALEFAWRVREVLFRIFVAHIQSQEPQASDLDHLNRAFSESLPHQRLRPFDDRYQWVWNKEINSPLAPIRPILQSAVELLTSKDLPRVRLCGGACCTWLFLDQSRNGSRRWCSMETCGNRAKAKRHYLRCQGSSDRPDGLGPMPNKPLNSV